MRKREIHFKKDSRAGSGRAEFFFDKTLGCLGMVAIGDALGMPAHDMTREEIKKRFGNSIASFQAPFEDSRVHRALRAGQVTDDTLLTLAVARAYLDSGGKITPERVAIYTASAVNEASRKGLESLFGMSTRQAVKLFNSGEDPVRAGRREKNPLIGATNGGAMKISPAGLVHPGDIHGAVKDAAAVCLPTHGTQAAISAAAAIAAGVAEAMNAGATVFSVVKAALAGSEEGEILGKKVARTVPVPSVPMRIRMAISSALKSRTAEEAAVLFTDLVGTGLPAYESIPTAIGIFLACGGDPAECVKMGANIGNDTDTIASMAGALAGAFRGFAHVPKKWFDTVQRVNGLDLAAAAGSLAKIARHGR